MSDSGHTDGSPATLAQAEATRLKRRKRQIYLLGLVCAALIVLLSWADRDATDAFSATVYPIFGVALLSMVPVVWREVVDMRKLEALLFSMLAAFVVSRLSWHLNFADTLDSNLLLLAGGHYWAVGILIVAGFVMLGYKRGLAAGGIVLGISALLAAIALGPQSNGEGTSSETWLYLVRIHLFLLLLLGLTSAATIMRNQLSIALERADTLDQWARTDALTGLANRHATNAFLEQRAAEVNRYGRPVSVILLDLDHFKRVNDTYGHAIGDAVLAEIARLLTDHARKPDFVARWGGEEFLIVAPDSPVDAAAALAERIRVVMAEQPIAGINITATLGVAEFAPNDTVDAVLSRADAMLYQGKESGRNQVVAAPSVTQTDPVEPA